jgi:hypothetical protein
VLLDDVDVGTVGLPTREAFAAARVCRGASGGAAREKIGGVDWHEQ